MRFRCLKLPRKVMISMVYQKLKRGHAETVGQINPFLYTNVVVEDNKYKCVDDTCAQLLSTKGRYFTLVGQQLRLYAGCAAALSPLLDERLTLFWSQVDNNSFFVQCTGQIVSGEFGPVDYLYCRYTFSYGNDWTISSGLDTGLSQTACKNISNSDEQIVWNFPIDISFNTTNVFGWPRIAISVYGIDFLGRDVIRGYGSALIPLSSGQHQVEVDMFNPLATSYMNELASWFMGNPPEFFDSKFVCQSEGREVSRVKKSGKLLLNLNVVTKGMQGFGYAIRDTNN